MAIPWNLAGALTLAFAAVVAAAPPAAADEAACDPAALAGALGYPVEVNRCFGWAYVSRPGLVGDTSSLMRLADGNWTKYTDFPSPICLAQARSDGVPEPEDWFTSC